jgi:putative NIF3 family GTP cyclohydrolase 1 type 2
MRFTAAQTAGQVDGAAVFAAARADVALLALHTNVDCAPAAYQLLLEMIGLNFLRPLQPEINLLGQIAEPGEATAIELEALACKCQQAFGQVYSVWGSPSKPIKTIAICSGGASEVLPSVIKVKPDCFITGELAHHEHLYLADADIALIELGHDLSELPYCSLFISTLKAAGVAEDLIEMIKPSATWWTPSNQQNETIFDPFPRQVTSNPLRNVHADLAPRQVTLLTDQSDKQSTKGRSLE